MNLEIQITKSKRAARKKSLKSADGEFLSYREPNGQYTTGKMRAMLISAIKRYYRWTIKSELNEDVFQLLEMVLYTNKYSEDMADIKRASCEISRELYYLCKRSGYQHKNGRWIRKEKQANYLAMSFQ